MPYDKHYGPRDRDLEPIKSEQELREEERRIRADIDAFIESGGVVEVCSKPTIAKLKAEFQSRMKYLGKFGKGKGDDDANS